MQIQAKCKHDLASVRALVHLGMFKKADPKKRMRFWSITYAVLLLVVIAEIILFDSDGILYILCGADIAVYLLLCYWYFGLPAVRYRAMAKTKDAENAYIFSEDGLKISTKSQLYNGETEMEYALLVRVYETSQYFFLYLTNNQVLLVDKSTVVGGSAEDIRSKLAAFVKDKYILCNY